MNENMWLEKSHVGGRATLSEVESIPSFEVAGCSQKHVYYKKFAWRNVYILLFS